MYVLNSKKDNSTLGITIAAKDTVCCSERQICRYRIISDFTNSITSINLDGTDYTLTATDSTTFRIQLAAIFESQGYSEIQSRGIRIEQDGTDSIINIYTDATITTYTDITVNTVDTFCEELYISRHYKSFLTNLAAISVNGTSYNLATGVYIYTGVTATDTTTASTLRADIETVLATSNTLYDRVRTSITGGVYTFSIYSSSLDVFKIGNIQITKDYSDYKGYL